MNQNDTSELHIPKDNPDENKIIQKTVATIIGGKTTELQKTTPDQNYIYQKTTRTKRKKRVIGAIVPNLLDFVHFSPRSILIGKYVSLN